MYLFINLCFSVGAKVIQISWILKV